MNFSQSSSIASENDCKSFFYETVPLRYSSAESFYGLLVAAAVLSLTTCPFTILLNALVVVAVKTKRRLQTHPNILLACLALTDLMVGLVAQPLHITKTILLLQGKHFYEFCVIDFAFTVSFLMLVMATSCHLFLISGERYLAIKHTFTHANVVTKPRLIVCSALAWISAALMFLLISYVTVFSFVFHATFFFSIVLLQILVYKEARRHEQQILSLQVSEEPRAKFKKEMKALKLTTIILVTLFLCSFLPGVIMFVTWQLLKEFFSPDVKTVVRHFSLLPMFINSVLNPVIYTVRKREFRVAFIELILKKNLQEAEELERRMFRSTNDDVRQQDGQESEGQEQNAEERNQVPGTNDNQEDNPEVIASDANFVDNTNLAIENESVVSNAMTITSKEPEEEHGGGRNPAHATDKHENNSGGLASGTNFDESTNFNSQNEPAYSNAVHSLSKETEEEYGEGRNLAHAKNNQDEKLSDNANPATRNKPVTINTLNSTSKKTEEKHGEGSNPPPSENKQDNSEVLFYGANFDDDTNLTTHNEPVSSNARNNTYTKTEEEHGDGRKPDHTENKQEDNPEFLA